MQLKRHQPPTGPSKDLMSSPVTATETSYPPTSLRGAGWIQWRIGMCRGEFVLRIIVEQFLDWNFSLNIYCVDIEKAFVSIHHPPLRKFSRVCGFPSKNINILKDMHVHNQYCVQHECQQLDLIHAKNWSQTRLRDLTCSFPRCRHPHSSYRNQGCDG